MHQPATTCPTCGTPQLARSRFCPNCGASVSAPPTTASEELHLPGKRVRVSADALSLRELLGVVEAGVALWQQRLQSADEVTREHAARAIKDLSQILDSLSQQLALGRDTVQITRRLPTLRSYGQGCPICGRGNRSGARFCQNCGSTLLEPGAAMLTGALPVTTASRSDVGQERKNNEDSCFAGSMKPAGITLCLVADGMGGAQAGEVASSIASETVQRDVQAALQQGTPTEDEDWHALLRRCVVAANKQVYDQARSSSTQRGMGTTLTTLVLAGERAHLAHVGDSRAYLISASGATSEGQNWLQLSNDHSLVARLLDIGQLTPEEARVHPQRNMLYRSLGTDPQVEVDVGSYSIQAGDLLLLCSDGLTNYIEDAELARMALAAPSLQVACDRLVALANQRGGRDNISVVLAKVGIGS